MHAQTNPLQRVYDCVRCACANSRTCHTKTRLEATLPFRTLEMQLQFSLHAGLFTSGAGMLPSAKAHAYARRSYTCTFALPCIRHAHARMHALHNVHMRVPYGTESQKRASLMQHCIVAASPRSIQHGLSWCSFSATADCALHPYVSATYRRPIPRTRKQGRVFARRRRKVWKLGSETVEF